MDTLKLKGIVIKSIDYKESSKIVYVLTEEGIISVLAKGAKRLKSKFLNFCEPLSLISFEVTNKEFPSLIDYTLLDPYLEIKNDLKRNLFFLYILELTNKLPKDIKYKNTFNLLLQTLNLGKKENPLLLALIYQSKILALYGVNPQFNCCVICQSKDIVSFSIKDGGMTCKNHLVNFNYPFKLANDFKRLYYFDIYNGDLEELNDIDLLNLFDLINDYYFYHTEIKLHSISSLIF